MKKFIAGLFIGFVFVAGVVYAQTIIHSENTVVNEVVEEEKTLKGVGYNTQPITIIGTAPTSSALLNVSNSVYHPTTTTSTSYVAFGNEIDQVDMFLWVNSTTSESNGVLWYTEVSPDLNKATSSTNFYSMDAASSSNGVVTHQAATTTHQWAAPAGEEHAKWFTICSNYDGGDDMPSCNAGWYKFSVSRLNKYGNVEIYAEVVGKSN